MTNEVTVNLGELFSQKIKEQPLRRVKTKKIKVKKNFKESGILGVSKMHSANYSQGYSFVLKYINEQNRQQIIQKKTLKELYVYAQSKGLDFVVSDKKKARLFIDKNTKTDDDYRFLFYNIIMQENQ